MSAEPDQLAAGQPVDLDPVAAIQAGVEAVRRVGDPERRLGALVKLLDESALAIRAWEGRIARIQGAISGLKQEDTAVRRFRGRLRKPLAALASSFADPGSVLVAFEKVVTTEGVAAAMDRLKSAPESLGRMLGAALFGMSTAARGEALANLAERVVPAMEAIAPDYPDYIRGKNEDFATQVADHEGQLGAVGAVLVRLREKREDIELEVLRCAEAVGVPEQALDANVRQRLTQIRQRLEKRAEAVKRMAAGTTAKATAEEMAKKKGG